MLVLLILFSLGLVSRLLIEPAASYFSMLVSSFRDKFCVVVRWPSQAGLFSLLISHIICRMVRILIVSICSRAPVTVSIG